jgi:hypothetical protein
VKGPLKVDCSSITLGECSRCHKGPFGN